MSNLLNKVKDAVGGHKDHSGTTHGEHGTHHSTTHNTTTTSSAGYDNPQSTNSGPHSSNILNKADPRVDSDRDNRNDPTSRVGGYGTQDTYNTGSGIGGQHGTAGAPGSTIGHGSTTTGGYGDNTSYGSGTTGTHNQGGLGSNTGYDNSQSTNAGPHSSNFANKLDPRVDSDRDNRNDPTSRVGGYGNQDNYNTGTGVGGQGQHTTPGGTAFGGTGTSNYGSTGTAGPHSSDMANRVDPRVDSDMDGNRTYGQAGGADLGQTHGGPGHHGHHQGQGLGHQNQGLGNDQYGSSTHPGSGTAQGTAGPHNSNLLNKLDPRVDSDLSGGKTYGGNATNQ